MVSLLIVIKIHCINLLFTKVWSAYNISKNNHLFHPSPITSIFASLVYRDTNQIVNEKSQSIPFLNAVTETRAARCKYSEIQTRQLQWSLLVTQAASSAWPFFPRNSSAALFRLRFLCSRTARASVAISAAGRQSLIFVGEASFN